MALVVTMSAEFPRRREGRAQVEQLSNLAVPLTTQASFLARRPGSELPMGQRLVAEALANQAAAMGIRLLVFDEAGRVQFDTGGGEKSEPRLGRTLDSYAAEVAEVRRRAAAADGGIVRRLAVPATGKSDPLDGSRLVPASDVRQPTVVVGVAAPRRVPPLIGRFVRPLLIVLALSLMVGAVVGSYLSRRIAAPVDRLTVAADAIAAGELEQRVAGEGADEVGRLVASFITMSARVAATAQSQRRLLLDVAHELRTPLTAVRGYAQAVRDGVATAPSERARALTTIVEETERMDRLVRELLDLSRLESGQVELRLGPVGAEPALERVVERIAAAAARRAVRFSSWAPVGLAVVADEARLAQVLGNLVDNALRYTPAGGDVRVVAEEGRAPTGGNGTVRLIVEDSGQGIPAGALERIIERFGRRDRPDQGDGFGLGLAIVRELVVAHGGTIAVASEVGRGTKVTVELPASAGGQERAVRRASGAVPERRWTADEQECTG